MTDQIARLEWKVLHFPTVLFYCRLVHTTLSSAIKVLPMPSYSLGARRNLRVGCRKEFSASAICYPLTAVPICIAGERPPDTHTQAFKYTHTVKERERERERCATGNNVTGRHKSAFNTGNSFERYKTADVIRLQRPTCRRQTRRLTDLWDTGYDTQRQTLCSFWSWSVHCTRDWTHAGFYRVKYAFLV